MDNMDLDLDWTYREAAFDEFKENRLTYAHDNSHPCVKLVFNTLGRVHPVRYSDICQFMERLWWGQQGKAVANQAKERRDVIDKVFRRYAKIIKLQRVSNGPIKLGMIVFFVNEKGLAWHMGLVVEGPNGLEILCLSESKDSLETWDVTLENVEFYVK